MSAGQISGKGTTLEARLAGSYQQRYVQELLRNSGQFPIANFLLELLLEGTEIFRHPDIYVLIAAALVQAWVVVRWDQARTPRPFLGNLVGSATYTVVEFAFEGAAFFNAPNHIAYWCFAVAIGALQWARIRAPRGAGALVVTESVVKALILFVMYAIFEVLTDVRPFSVSVFLADSSHVFVGLATLLFGLSAGIESRSAQNYLEILRETSAQLKRYSEWLLGEELLERVIKDPAVLSLARRERTILFMDIRGFTAWSERCTPETVVQALNQYYAAAEPVLRRHGVIKLKFTADEVLGVFADPRTAAVCALELRAATVASLSPWGLAAGIGVHAGPVVEGLLGSAGVKGYDVIGDTVNTAKRIEGAAAGGEALVTDYVCAALDPAMATGPRRELVAKGKENPLGIYPLL